MLPLKPGMEAAQQGGDTPTNPSSQSAGWSSSRSLGLETSALSYPSH